jgi:hypothetical protein
MVFVISVIAAVVQRRWPDRLAAASLVTIAWGIAGVVAYRMLMSGLPPIPWSTAALEKEPWESIVYTLFALCILWPWVRSFAKQTPDVRWLMSIALACLPILGALNIVEYHAPLHAGNGYWVLFTLLSIAFNHLTMERMDASGAGRWSLWVLVAQLLLAGALIMTCYGRFGEWSVLTAISLGAVAIVRVFVPDDENRWTGSIALPALALSGTLLMHIRDYSSQALPVWLAPVPLLMPAVVGFIDQAMGVNRSAPLRVVIAAATSIVLVAIVLAVVLSKSDGW